MLLLLLGFHALTACDQTSWKGFIQSDDNIIGAFQQFGENDGDLNIDVIKHLEKYAIKLFSTLHINATLTQARWYIASALNFNVLWSHLTSKMVYSKYQDCQRFTQTASALKFKVLRSHLTLFDHEDIPMAAPKIT